MERTKISFKNSSSNEYLNSKHAINQSPEDVARDKIDSMLRSAGWSVQDKNKINLFESLGVAVREYQTDVGFADYVLFVDTEPVGVIEAKREDEGIRLISAEEQSSGYANANLKYNLNKKPLPFVYESTGIRTRFTDYRDPKPRSREVFHFHQPSTFLEWSKEEKTLRARLQTLPALDKEGLRNAQIKAIENLEDSFKKNKPRALIQMATGAGKTYTACTFVYRLLKFAKAKRILFIVDTKNLGEQAEQEFIKYQPKDDNRKFTELYNVQRLSSSYVAGDSQVCISTIQRLYSVLKGEELDESSEEENPNENSWDWKKEPIPVEYSKNHPIEQFDFIIIDECHRSIYNLWKQVLDYYDSFLIGLTATPDSRTFAFFNENVVSEYTYEESVIDGVNVPYDVFIIKTEITAAGAKLKAKEFVDKRDRMTRKMRWEQLDEEIVYSSNDLDKNVVNKSQIRNIIRAYKDALPHIFPDRFDEKGVFEVPKTLVFAKTDSHADDIIQIIREEFDEKNDFCKKVTYKTDEDPKSILNKFRNTWDPRIAVTVDMIATGTDVKPLEVLMFMRDVRSSNYFEQMKGRGTRTISYDDLKKVSTTAKHTKTHFIIIDAIGVTESVKTDSRPLEKKRGTPLKDLLNAVAVGAKDEDLFTSLANRLIRLDKQLTDNEKDKIIEKSGGIDLKEITKNLLNAYNPDIIDFKTNELLNKLPEDERSVDKEVKCRIKAKKELVQKAASVFTGEFNQYIENIRKAHEQIIDVINQDKVIDEGFVGFTKDRAKELVTNFEGYIKENKNEILALSIYYNQPHRLKDITSKMIDDLYEQIILNKPVFAPEYVWDAYKKLGEVKESCPKNKLIALVSLIRKVTGIDENLISFNKTVDKNFQDWVFAKQAGALKYTKEQMEWLRMIKDYIVSSFHIEKNDFSLSPFDGKGGLGKMYKLFGEETYNIINELNIVLTA